MKKILLAGLLTWGGWTCSVQAQATLGVPTVNVAAGEIGHDSAVPLVARPEGRFPLCQAGFGLLAKGMLAPIRRATGTLAPPHYVEMVSKEEVARMTADGGYSPAEMAAVKIKLDEAQAKNRCTAVRYLAGVNGHYYPEAEAGLIAALRADRNECVRLEAALALGACACPTSRIAEALQIAAQGSESDGNPAEISPRVRSAAREALHRCQAQGVGVPSEPPQKLPPADFSAPAPLPQPQSLPPPLMIQTSGFASAPAELLAERRRAEAVGIAPSVAATPAAPRSFYQFLFSGRSFTHPATEPASSLHPLGLTPIGAETSLAIPRTTPASTYNH